MNQRILTNFAHVIKERHNLLSRKDTKTLKIDDKLLPQLRYVIHKLFRKMVDTDPAESLMLTPPEGVKGMTELRREAFTKSIKVPGLKVAKREISRSQKTWRPLLLKLSGLRPVAQLSDKDPVKDTHSLILLDPRKVSDGGKNLQPSQIEMLQKLGLDLEKPDMYEVQLGYENWSLSDIMRAVLPSDVENVASYTQIGHIAHFNLKPETLPFKHLIGQVVLDKNASVKTVVNKLNNIDNTYRNFIMELLAGEDNFITQTKEHNCVFELDFSKVYWNSRLATEHQRIVEFIPNGSTVYDVFAGIGPFTIPLAKKKNCVVFANDLNPASYNALNKNTKLNKIKDGSVEPYNLDGREFILSVVKTNLEKRIKEYVKAYYTKSQQSVDEDSTIDREKDETTIIVTPVQMLKDTLEQQDLQKTQTPHQSYVVMNLPAIAVEFLDAFSCLLSTDCLKHEISIGGNTRNSGDLRQNESVRDLSKIVEPVLPQVYCYAFSSREAIDSELKSHVESHLGCPVPADYETRIVRNVAPNKEMVCITFKLWSDLVFAPVSSAEDMDKMANKAQVTKRDLSPEDETNSKRTRLADSGNK